MGSAMFEGFKLFNVIDVRMTDVIDITVVSIVFYYLFLLFRGTRAVQMFFGFAILIVLYFISLWWDLRGVSFLFSNLAAVGVISLVILFQPELRGALTRIGQSASQTSFHKLFFHSNESDNLVSQVVIAACDLSRNRIGALIVLEQKVGLRNFIGTGVEIDARVSSQLIKSLFFPNSPMHDGAVIISHNRIAAAGCILPVQTAIELDEDLGMRHRAARALASESDALIVVVSEETSTISLAFRNSLLRNLNAESLEKEINNRIKENVEA
jgi:diadenylate cyclase